MELDQESLQKIAQKADGREIPILALRNAVLFPDRNAFGSGP